MKNNIEIYKLYFSILIFQYIILVKIKYSVDTIYNVNKIFNHIFKQPAGI